MKSHLLSGVKSGERSTADEVTVFCAIICEAKAQKTGALAVQCRPLAARTVVDKLVIHLLVS